MKTTFRIVAPDAPTVVGRAAARPELAMLSLSSLDRGFVLALEQTDWIEKYDKWTVNRTIILDAEDRPGQWTTDAPGDWQKFSSSAPDAMQSQVFSQPRRAAVAEQHFNSFAEPTDRA